MTQNVDLEIKVVKKYIVNVKQDRYIQFISSPKNRHKFIADLAHFNFLQWDKFDKVNGNETEIIMATLKKRKVLDSNCYIISENKDIDTKILDIKSAINKIVGYGMGTILVFGIADTIYYESEPMNIRYISKNY